MSGVSRRALLGASAFLPLARVMPPLPSASPLYGVAPAMAALEMLEAMRARAWDYLYADLFDDLAGCGKAAARVCADGSVEHIELEDLSGDPEDYGDGEE